MEFDLLYDDDSDNNDNDNDNNDNDNDVGGNNDGDNGNKIVGRRKPQPGKPNEKRAKRGQEKCGV